MKGETESTKRRKLEVSNLFELKADEAVMELLQGERALMDSSKFAARQDLPLSAPQGLEFWILRARSGP